MSAHPTYDSYLGTAKYTIAFCLHIELLLNISKIYESILPPYPAYDLLKNSNIHESILSEFRGKQFILILKQNTNLS